MSEWQPIETAPKNGTYVLLYGEPWDDGRPSAQVARWKAERREEWEYVNADTQKRRVVEDGWWECELYATHWMPLPAPPVSGPGVRET